MRRVACAVTIALFAAVVFGMPACDAAPIQEPPKPEVRVANLEQLDAALAAHRGKAVLVNFWAIWCEPCVAELPELVEVAHAFRGKNAVVLTVSYDLMIPEVTPEGVLAQVREFVAARSMDLPVYIFDGPDYDAINERYGLPGPVPVTIAIDANGAVVDRHAGKGGKAQFEALLRNALGS